MTIKGNDSDDEKGWDSDEEDEEPGEKRNPKKPLQDVRPSKKKRDNTPPRLGSTSRLLKGLSPQIQT